MLLFETLFLHSIFKALYKKFLSILIMTMSETNIFEIKKFCVYFENQPEQLGAFKRNMHEQTGVDIHFDASYQQALSLVRSVVNGKNEETEWKTQKWISSLSWKPERAA